MIHSTLALLVLVAFPAAAPAQIVPPSGGDDSSPERPQENPNVVLHREADRALKARELESAGSAFRRALELDPANPTLAYGIACCHVHQGDTDQAFEWLERAVELGYRDAQVARADLDLSRLRRAERFEKLFPLPDEAVPPGSQWRIGSGDQVAAMISSEGGGIALAHANGGVDLLDSATGERRHRLGIELSPSAALCGSPDGSVLATVHADGTLVRWRTADGVRLSLDDTMTRLRSSRWRPTLAYSAGGERIVVSVHRTVHVFDKAGRHLRTHNLDEQSGYPSIAFGPQSPLLASSFGSEVRFIDARTGAPHGDPLTFDGRVTSLAYSPGGEVLAVGTVDARLHLYELEDRKLRWSGTIIDTMTGTNTDPFGEEMRLTPIRFAPSGAHVVACTTSGYFVGCFDVESGKKLWQSDHLGGRMYAPMPLVTGDHIVVGDGGMHAWNIADGNRLKGWPRGTHRVVSVGPAGALFIAGQGIELVGETSRKVLATYDGGPPIRVVRHPSGWVAGDTSGLGIDPLQFDPKRIRIARRGVPLHAPPERGPR